MSNDYERWTRDEVDMWPGASVTFGDRAKHREAVLTFGATSQFVTYPATPGDSVRGIYNHIATVRRMLVEMGAVRQVVAKSSRPAKRRNPGADERDLFVGEPAPVIADPWEALKALADRPLIVAPGAYSNISNEDYHRSSNLLPAPSLSASGMKLLLSKSPAHFWYDSPLNPNRPAEPDKPHFSIGKAAHDVLLLDDRWPTHYHVLPEAFNANATKAQADWHAERDEAREAGKVVLRHEEAQTVMAMADSLRRNELAAKLLVNGESEVTLAWQDEKTGVWLRARPDFLPARRRIIPDLKTCADGSPKAFSRAIGSHGYALAAAVYLEGIRVLFGEDLHRAWIHIAIEKEAPHVVALWQLPPEDILRGHHLFRRAVNLFADCLRADRWPGYADAPAMCGLPGWDRKEIDEGTTFDGVTHHQKQWMEAA